MWNNSFELTLCDLYMLCMLCVLDGVFDELNYCAWNLGVCCSVVFGTLVVVSVFSIM